MPKEVCGTKNSICILKVLTGEKTTATWLLYSLQVQSHRGTKYMFLVSSLLPTFVYRSQGKMSNRNLENNCYLKNFQNF